MRGHRFAPALADPGEQDLTAHVDFEAIAARRARCRRSVTPVVTQGEWLQRLGIERARAGACRAPTRSAPTKSVGASIGSADADQMGELFKVMAIHAPDWPAPAGFA